MRAFARCCYVALMHSQNDPTHDPSHEGQRAQSTRRVSTSQVLAILGTIIIVLLLFFAPHNSERAAELPASWWIGTLPFAALLGAIAVFPLLPRLAHWWHSNLNRYLVTLCASSCALIYIGTTSGMSGVGAALHHAIPDEYVPFMSLLFALRDRWRHAHRNAVLWKAAREPIDLGAGCAVCKFRGHHWRGDDFDSSAA
ncbi:MAG: hypothetical protein DWH97_10725 [Planctomycetota bacterium]|nr:MAG: hypothetical protein DWH97_10725 [Planctomycetota bacterium]